MIKIDLNLRTMFSLFFLAEQNVFLLGRPSVMVNINQQAWEDNSQQHHYANNIWGVEHDLLSLCS